RWNKKLKSGWVKEPQIRKRTLNAANDPLPPLSLALPAAAMPRYQPFSHGPSMGAFGHKPPSNLSRHDGEGPIICQGHAARADVPLGGVADQSLKKGALMTLPPVAQDSPEARMREMLGGYRITQMLYVAAKLGLPDLLAEGPKTAVELAI